MFRLQPLALTICLCLNIAAAPVRAQAQAGTGQWNIRHLGVADGLPAPQVNALAQDSLGFLWIGTDAGFCRFDGLFFKLFLFAPDSLPIGKVLHLKVAPDNSLEIRSVRGVFRYHNRKLVQAAPPRLDAPPSPVETFRGGTRFFVLEKKLFSQAFGENTPRFRFELAEHLRQPQALLADNFGNLWIGDSDGLVCLRERDFLSFAVRGPVSGMLQASDGDFLIGAESANGLPPGSQALGPMSAIFEDSRGRIWVALPQGGLYFLKNGRKTHFIPEKKGLPPGIVRFFLETQRGELWAGGQGGLTQILTDAKTEAVSFLNFPFCQDCNFREFRFGLEGADGSIWLSDGLAGSGFLRFQKGNFDKILYTRWQNRVLSGVAADRKGNIWVSTQGAGISKSRIVGRDSIVIAKRYTLLDGLRTEVFTDIVLDERGRVWAAHQSGVCLLDDTDPAAGTRIISYDHTDGFPDRRFRSPRLYRDRSGTIWFYDANGLVSFRPAAMQHDVRPPHVEIEEIIVNDGNLPLSPFVVQRDSAGVPSALALPDTLRSLAFRISVVHLKNPLRTRFAFNFSDEPSTWRFEQGQNTILLPEPRENFTFFVRGINSDGVYGAAAPLVAGRVREKFMHTALARNIGILLLLTVAAMGLRLYILRINRHRERELAARKLELAKEKALREERNRIAAEMHDDLGSGLSTIRFLGERAVRRELSPESRQYVARISESATDLMEKMRDIVWAMNSRNDTLDNLVSYLRAYAVEYLETHGLACTFDCPDNLPARVMSGEKRRNILLTVKEALHNVVKHAGARQVNIQVNCSDNLQIVVKDDGRGLPDPNPAKDAKHPLGNGLRNMKNRMESIGGSFRIENGTGVTVWLMV